MKAALRYARRLVRRFEMARRYHWTVEQAKAADDAEIEVLLWYDWLRNAVIQQKREMGK